MKLSLLFMFTFSTVLVLAASPKSSSSSSTLSPPSSSTAAAAAAAATVVNEKTILYQLNDLVEVIINYEKGNVKELKSQLDEIDQKLQQQINDTIEGAKMDLELIRKKTNESLQNFNGKNDKKKKCIERYHQRVENTFTKSKDQIKVCNENTLKDAKGYHDKVEEHINSVNNLIKDMERITKDCTQKNPKATNCIIAKSQNAKNKISARLIDAKDSIQDVLNKLPSESRKIHQCAKRVLHTVQKEADEIVKKIESCIQQTLKK